MIYCPQQVASVNSLFRAQGPPFYSNPNWFSLPTAKPFIYLLPYTPSSLSEAIYQLVFWEALAGVSPRGVFQQRGSQSADSIRYWFGSFDAWASLPMHSLPQADNSPSALYFPNSKQTKQGKLVHFPQKRESIVDVKIITHPIFERNY